uniref:Carboxylic ester hydrolase n=1 Tax=Acrobeloides nanus TaxID=290746 RepID=A0A914E9I2_9BILA
MTNTSYAYKLFPNISEDCLYLNIWADKRCTQANPCPIIVRIFGGAFLYGSAIQNNEDFTIDRYASDRIVFVVPAYRIGLFGFMDLGSDDPVPRNLGLHDLIKSLKWVQNEIKSFGGDPKRVTLFGNSAGATAIQFLSVSPAVAKGLFSGALISSGFPETITGIERTASKTLVQISGCSNKNTSAENVDEIVKCLRRIDAKSLLQMGRFLEDTQNIVFGGVSIDGLLFHNKSFIELLDDLKPMPTLIGATKDEMDEVVHNITYICQKDIRTFGYKTEDVMLACLNKYGKIEGDEKYRIASADVIHAMVYKQAVTNSRNGVPSYVWDFQLANHSYHADDLFFLTGSRRNEILTPEEKIVDEFYSQVVKQYVRTENPGSGWKPFKNGRNFQIFDAKIENGTIYPPYLSKGEYYPEAGIPFAETPIGDLRFALPQSKTPWNSLLDAKNYQPACMTNTSHAHKPFPNISEDCLYLNIWADKRCTQESPCPIIVLIFGGGFLYGSATQFYDDFIIDRYASDRIVFVVPAYRLGLFGFMDLGSDDPVPRNLGLH